MDLHILRKQMLLLHYLELIQQDLVISSSQAPDVLYQVPEDLLTIL